PEIRSWVSAEGLARGAPATLLPLVKRPLDVVFSRSWGGSSFRLVRPSGAAGMRFAPKRAPAPRGTERVVVTLTGWVELRSVRLRGVVDPDWRERVRAERRSRAEKALARAFGERDAARRAKALESVRAQYPDCRVVGLRATRGAAKAHQAAGNRSRARATEALARFWYPEFDAAAAPGKGKKGPPGPEGRSGPAGR
ncbi:MAG: hypothetical protein ACYSU0_15225, partial [Planctomycetota bacterium]